MPAVFASNAEEIRFYIKELLADGELHTKGEIRFYVKNNAPSGGTFTEGMISGALRDLVKKSHGEYIDLSRGKYQKNAECVTENSGQALRQRIADIIYSTCQSLGDACTINIIGLSQREIDLANKVSRVISDLKIFAEELSEQV